MAAAASSQMTVTSGWNCKIEPGTSGVTGPKKTLQRISALSVPVMTMTIFRAAMTVPTPIVTAAVGTSLDGREEALVRLAGHVRQLHLVRYDGEMVAGLVEADVAVMADAE